MEAAQYVIQFWSRTRGRDKMNRLLQYSVGLHSSRLERSGETLLAQEWMQISKQVSLGRKLFRTFRSLEFLVELRKAMRDRDPVRRLLGCSRHIGYAVFFFLDMLVWSARVGLTRGRVDDKRWSRIQMRFWVVTCLVDAALSLYKLIQSMENERQHHKTGGDGGRVPTSSYKREQQHHAVNVVRVCCDAIVALSRTAWLPSDPSPLLVYSSGVFSSLIGCWQVAPSLHPKQA